MQDLMVLVSVFIGLVALGILIAITVGICDLVNFIRNKRHKKWCAWVFENHPELEELLFEYKRTRNNTVYTIKKIEEIKQEITKQVEENKYLPKGDRVDGYIETLKESYIWLKDLLEKQREEEKEKKEALTKFWETNFPDLPEHKRLMWWSE
jgi:seryl-tRNA synthetase